MKQKFSEKDVVDLLAGLKDAGNSYPSDMIRSRREVYLQQAAAMAVLDVAGGNGSNPSAGSQLTATGTSGGGLFTGNLLQTLLVAALVVELGVATYVFRGEISHFINSTLFPPVEQTSSSPDILPGDVVYTETPSGTVSVSETAAPSITLSPQPGGSVGGTNTGSNTGDVQVTSTPNPNTNPGLHLGQTKQPTQETDDDVQNNNGNGNSNRKDQKDKGKDE